MAEMERRTFAAELRVKDSSYGSKNPTIEGYAARFNTLSEPMPIIVDGEKIGTFREELLPGCFASAIPTSDIRALINHDANLILGRSLSGTLRVFEDEHGLAFSNDPPDTTYAKDLQISMRRGDISQCSFGFVVSENGDSYRKDPNTVNGYIRSISKIERLFDVSPVTYPAYIDTNCAVRSLAQQIKGESEEIAKRMEEQDEQERARIADFNRRQLELAEIGDCIPELRTSLGHAEYNKVGTCDKCNEEGCMCSACENVSWCNMKTAMDAGCCTKMLSPKCNCLQCPNTDSSRMKQMWSI